MSSRYVWVQGELEVQTDLAIKLSGIWIAKSCINGIDLETLKDAKPDDEIEIRIFEWLAEQEGFEYRRA